MPSSENKVLFVVRGAKDGFDATYACASHNTKPGNYAMIEVDTDAGKVTSRRIESSIDTVVKEASTYRGVYLDERSDKNLVAIPVLPNSQPADLDALRRPKSDEEILALSSLSAKTRSLVGMDSMTEQTFRGEANKLGNRAYFKVHHGKGFTEYRGGMQDDKGRCSDLTHVVAHNSKWKGILSRVNAGLDAVYEEAKEGSSVEGLDAIFRGFLEEGDKMMSSCVHCTGYESKEKFKSFDKLNAYDFLTFGVAISDGNDTALVYRATKDVQPERRVAPPLEKEVVRSSPPPPLPVQETQPEVVPRKSTFRGARMQMPMTRSLGNIEAIFA